MTDLQKLLDHMREVAGSRTTKGWRYAQLLDGIEARAILDGSGYLFGRSDDLQNGEFIVLADRHFDALLSVAEAATTRQMWRGITCPACNSDDPTGLPCYCIDQIDSDKLLDKALAKLGEVKINQ
jgi:hypothetical protein